MRVLVHIPARAGSKGLPRKNLAPVGCLSLVAHAVRLGDALLEHLGCEGTVLVDTDGAEIAEEAARCGRPVPFFRAESLASDHATTIDATLAALERLEAAGPRFDVVVLLQPTSPLRTLQNLVDCFDAHVATGSALTVSLPEHPVHRAVTMDSEKRLHALLGSESLRVPRQQLPRVVEPNGAVYVDTVAFLRQHRTFFVEGLTVGVEMPRALSVDVDTALDLAWSELLLDQQRPRVLPFMRSALARWASAAAEGVEVVVQAPDSTAAVAQPIVTLIREPADVVKCRGRTAGLLLPETSWSRAEVLDACREAGLPLVLEAGAGHAFSLARAIDSLGRVDLALLSRAPSSVRALRRTFCVPVGVAVDHAHDALGAVSQGAAFVLLERGGEDFDHLRRLHQQLNEGLHA